MMLWPSHATGVSGCQELSNINRPTPRNTAWESSAQTTFFGW